MLQILTNALKIHITVSIHVEILLEATPVPVILAIA